MPRGPRIPLRPAGGAELAQERQRHLQPLHGHALRGGLQVPVEIDAQDATGERPVALLRGLGAAPQQHGKVSVGHGQDRELDADERHRVPIGWRRVGTGGVGCGHVSCTMQRSHV